MTDMIERVARAIEGVDLFYRYNVGCSDSVQGLPIEICRHCPDGIEIEVLERHAGTDSMGPAVLLIAESRARARAAIEAMREPTEAMVERGAVSIYANGTIARAQWQAMITAALEP